MTQSPARPTPQLDLDYAIEDDMPPGVTTRDTQLVVKRMPELVAQLATPRSSGRVLDVGCGFGGQMELLRGRGWETWGLDASYDLSWYCKTRFAGEHPSPAVCAAAEALPFRAGSFNSIVCQGSLDHFVQPRAFLREVARVLKPDGRAVIAISNYDSLSCRLGSNLYRLKERFGRPVYRGRNYWQIPGNHTFRGTYRMLVRLGEPDLELIECRGVSLLWLFHRWTRLMQRLPDSIAWGAMRALDRVAYHRPSAADIVVSVWRPKKHDGREA